MKLNLDNNYLVWQLVETRYAFALTRFDDGFLKQTPGSLASLWPQGAYGVLEEEPGVSHPFLPDCLFNPQRRLFISPRLKNFLEKLVIADVEYWPLKILDPSGLPLGDPYFYMHLTNPPACLDLVASQATRSRILPGIAEKVKTLNFHSDPDRLLFRPAEFAKVTLVRWDLGEKLADEGFSGFRLMGLFDYGRRGDLPPDPRRHKVDTLSNRLNRKRSA